MHPKGTLLGLVLLAACGSPSVDFIGADRQQFTEGSFAADVFVKGSAVQVIRTSSSAHWRSDDIAALLIKAAMTVSGCTDIDVLEVEANTVLTAQTRC